MTKKSATKPRAPRKKTKSRTLSSGSDSSLLSELNAAQREAVTHRDGPLLIVAGAGTGKTTVITKRALWLIEQGLAEPDEILLLTFTEKAAGELEDRIESQLPLGHRELWIHTFHSFGQRILETYALDIGYEPGFSVLSEPGQWSIMRDLLHDLSLSYYKPHSNPTKFISALLTVFSRAKDECIAPEDLRAQSENALQSLEDKKPRPEMVSEYNDWLADHEIAERNLEVAKAYEAYQQVLQEKNLMDFGDLITTVLHLIEARPSIAREIRKKFRYILVDEFQDTNIAQYRLVKALATPHNNLTVCGDDDQSIYLFRGAAMANILQFKTDYPNAKEVVITENYRSTQGILDASYHLITKNNPRRLESQLGVTKKLKAARGSGVKPTLRAFGTLEEEIRGVAQDIIDVRAEKKANWSDFAILVRANAHADDFVRFFRRAKIPFTFVASRGLLTSPDIMDLCSYLRILINIRDGVNFFRVLNAPWVGIHPEDVPRIIYQVRKNATDIFETLGHLEVIQGIHEESLAAGKKLHEHLLAQLDATQQSTASQVILSFLEWSGWLDRLKKSESEEDEEMLTRIKRFFSLVQDFESRSRERHVADFMREIDMMIDAGEDPSPGDSAEGPDAVKILTVHMAKGLEWPYVYLVNLIDARFPSRAQAELIALPWKTEEVGIRPEDIHLEEERRLFYVALTRARERLTLTYAEDMGGKRKRKPSLFLQEILPMVEVDAPTKTTTLFSEITLTDGPVVSSDRASGLITIPTSLSFTQLEAFQNCPKQYWYAFVMNVPREPSWSASYGKSVHAVFARLARLLKAGEHPTEAEALEILNQEWINEWYQSAKQEREKFALAHVTVKQFFATEMETLVRTAHIEEPFRWKLGDVTLKGVIDRIDQLPDGTYEIIDYKTGKPKDEKTAKRGFQLPMYHLAAESALGISVSKCTYFYVTEGVKVDVTKSADELHAVRDALEETITALRDSSFLASPGMLCRFCDFNRICGDRQL